jgi:hypothetical protein
MCVFFFYTRTHLEIMLSRLLDGMHKSVYCLNSWRGCCSVWTDGSEMRIERYIRKREKSCGWAKSNETLKTSVYYSSGSSISFAVRLYHLHQQVIIRFFIIICIVYPSTSFGNIYHHTCLYLLCFLFFKGLLTLLHISRSYTSNLPVRYLPLHSWTKCHSHFFRFSLLYHFVGSIIVKKDRKIIFSDAIFLIRFPGMIKRRTTIPFWSTWFVCFFSSLLDFPSVYSLCCLFCRLCHDCISIPIGLHNRYRGKNKRGAREWERRRRRMTWLSFAMEMEISNM